MTLNDFYYADGSKLGTVQTVGLEVVDTFYVRANGALVTDTAYRTEIQRALLHAVS